MTLALLAVRRAYDGAELRVPLPRLDCVCRIWFAAGGYTEFSLAGLDAPGLARLPPLQVDGRAAGLSIIAPGGEAVGRATFPPLDVARFDPARLLPPPAVPIATAAGPLRAWRAWRVSAANGLTDAWLYSINAELRWDGPVMAADRAPEVLRERSFALPDFLAWDVRARFFSARVVPERNEVLVELHDLHGIYALKRRPADWEAYAGIGPFAVGGRVRLFGRVVEHERGYRAERAIIEELHYIPLGRNDAAAWQTIRGCLERRYQVDVLDGP